MPSRLEFRRTEGETATVMSYMRADGQFCAVQIADSADAETIAGQLRVLAEMLTRVNWTEGMEGSRKS